MTNVLDVIQLGNSIVRSHSRMVTSVSATSIQQLIDDLIVTVGDANGVGIAAPQVGRSHSIFIIASRPNLRYPHAPLMEPTAIINPKIVAHDSEVVKDWEGCLSIPGIRGLVPRYRTIEVEYTDRFGELQKQELTDFVARIFQHESDHLHGIVFLDRLESTRDIITEQEYQKLILDHP